MATAARLDPFPEVERRAKARYSIELEVSFHSSGKRPLAEGLGSTVNISSTGLLIRSAEHRVLPGDSLKISIDWPWMLDQVTPLRLVAIGSVVRTQPQAFALKLKRYQFRTAGRKHQAASA